MTRHLLAASASAAEPARRWQIVRFGPVFLLIARPGVLGVVFGLSRWFFELVD